MKYKIMFFLTMLASAVFVRAGHDADERLQLMFGGDPDLIFPFVDQPSLSWKKFFDNFNQMYGDRIIWRPKVLVEDNSESERLAGYRPCYSYDGLVSQDGTVDLQCKSRELGGRIILNAAKIKQLQLTPGSVRAMLLHEIGHGKINPIFNFEADKRALSILTPQLEHQGVTQENLDVLLHSDQYKAISRRWNEWQADQFVCNCALTADLGEYLQMWSLPNCMQRELLMDPKNATALQDAQRVYFPGEEQFRLDPEHPSSFERYLLAFNTLKQRAACGDLQAARWLVKS